MLIVSRYCTQSRGRTGKSLQTLVFETNASTDSAIWAKRHRKGNHFFQQCKYFVFLYQLHWNNWIFFFPL